MYPLVDIPVIQMRLDYTKAPQYHYELAKQLASLRQKRVLILGSALSLAIPNPEHFLPLLYILGLKEKNDRRLSLYDIFKHSLKT